MKLIILAFCFSISFITSQTKQQNNREDSLIQSALCSRKADSLYSLSQFHQAIIQYEKSLSFLNFNDIVDSIIASTVYSGISMCYYKIEDYENAYLNFQISKGFDKNLSFVVDYPIKKIFRFFNDGWYYLDSKEQMDFYYNKETIVYNNENIRVWIKVIWDKDEQERKKTDKEYQGELKKAKKIFGNADFLIQLMEVNCRMKTMRIIDLLYYSEKGELLDRYSDNFAEWDNIIPDTIGDSISRKNCK